MQKVVLYSGLELEHTNNELASHSSDGWDVFMCAFDLA